MLTRIFHRSFTTIIPSIVQNFANTQSIVVRAVNFTVISPTEFNLSVDVGLDLPVSAILYPLQPQVYNRYDNDTEAFSPIFNLSVPESRLGQGSSLHISEQTITVTNNPEFVQLVHRVWQDGTFPVSVRCSPRVGLSKLTFTPPLDRTIHLDSLGHIDGLILDNVGLIIPPNENGETIRGAFGLPNRMKVKFSVGTIIVDILVAGVRVAVLTIDDVTGPPGNAILPFHGQLFLPDILENLGPILSSLAGPLGRGDIEVNITGNANTIDGQHVPFIEDFLNNIIITLPIPVTKLVADIAGSLLGSRATSMGSTIGSVFSNQTLMSQILGHWEDSDRRKGVLGSSSLLQPFGGGAAVVQMLRGFGNMTDKKPL